MTKTHQAFYAGMLLEPVYEGFVGEYAEFAVVQDGVTIKGEERGYLHLPLSRIAKVQLGFTESRSGISYELKIWIEGERRPLSFCPNGTNNHEPYKATVRALALALQKDGAFSRVHTGVSKFSALIGPVLIGIVLAAALFVTVYAMDPLKWWHFIVIPGLPAVVLGILTWQAATRLWPRPARTLADLERQLPP